MPSSVPTTNLSPLLKMLHERQPGDLYSLASKDNLISGVSDCSHRTVTNAGWSDDRNTLTLYFGAHIRTTLTVEVLRIVSICDCRQWQPGRQCPHVVVAWATLKRLVSPGSLAHIRFNEHLLRDVAVMIGLENNNDSKPLTGQNPLQERLDEARRLRRAQRDRLLAAPVPSKFNDSPKPIRMVLSEENGRLHGAIQRGHDTISPWSTYSVPDEIARFLASNYYYESSPRYYETFLKITKGQYP